MEEVVMRVEDHEFHERHGHLNEFQFRGTHDLAESATAALQDVGGLAGEHAGEGEPAASPATSDLSVAVQGSPPARLIYCPRCDKTWPIGTPQSEVAEHVEKCREEYRSNLARRTSLDASTWSVEETMRFCRTVAGTEFVPRAFRGKPEAMLACIMTGREMGLGPMESLQQINVIDGRPAPSAQLMRRLILAAGHTLTIDELDNEHCTMTGRRRGYESSTSITWSMADAQRVGLHTKTVWKQYPRAMLLARCSAEIGRAQFPDVLGPARYTAEEIGGQPAEEDL